MLSTRIDSWINTITGLGDASRDKRLYGQITRRRLPTDQEYEALFYEDALAARIVHALPAAALRQGIIMRSQNGLDVSIVEQRLRELGVVEAVYRASVWGRLYGGAAILLDPSSTDLARPLRDLSKIQNLMVLTKRDLVPDTIQTDLINYGKPELFRLTNMPGRRAGNVHASHLVMFGGALTASRERQRLGWWDHSVLYSVLDDIRDYEAAWGAIGNMLQDASQGILSIKDFWGIMQGKHREAFEERLQMLSLARWVGRVMPLDTEEKFEYQERAFTGVPGLCDQYMMRLAAKTGIPVTVLFGRAPAGMNATGESDIRIWYDEVRAAQRDLYGPVLQRFVDLIAIEEGLGECSIEWPSLWQESPKEQTDRRKVLADTDVAYVTAGVCSASEISQARFGQGAAAWGEGPPVVEDVLQSVRERAHREVMEQDSWRQDPDVERTLPESWTSGSWQVQSIILEMSESEARRWLHEHDYYAGGIEGSERHWRARQYNPEYFSKFRNKVLTDQITLVLGKVK